jgi:hypothetical protein
MGGELKKWIKEHKQKGYSQEQIYSHLIQQGYDESEVKKAIQSIYSSGSKLRIFYILLICFVVLGILMFSIGHFFIGRGDSNNNSSQVLVNNTPVNLTKNHPSFLSLPVSDRGLIIIKKGASSENYSKQIAEERGWLFRSVESSNPDEIKNQIRTEYNANKFNYLLIVGTNEEIPYAKLREGHQKGSTEYGSYETDPSLYADINDDGFVEISVGRLPFSSEEEVKKYFTDLSPQGDNYYFEYYPFDYDDNDPLDENTVKSFTYGQCLSKMSSSIKVNKYSKTDELIAHYRTGKLIEINSHGSDSAFAVGSEGMFSIRSFCENCDKSQLPPGDTCNCDAPPYLTNRPILVHLTCNNAINFGPQLIKSGASAFIGAYTVSGETSKSLSQNILFGTSVGDSFREMFNAQLVKSATVHMGDDYDPTIANIEGINTFDVTKLKKPIDAYGLILYGDPSLKLNDSVKAEQQIAVEQNNGELELTIKPARIYDMTNKDFLLCYYGKYVQGASFINRDYWGEQTNFRAAHSIKLIFPVSNITRLKSTKAIVDGQEIVLPDKTEGQIYYGEYRVNLLKGESEEELFVLLSDPSLIYSNEVKIIIDYE